MTVKTEKDLAGLRRVGRVVALALRAMKEAVGSGMTTADLEAVGARVLVEHGARSAPQLVYDFPSAFCISVNDEVVHGISGRRLLGPGDLVKIDVTAELDGYIADATVTVALPPVSEIARQLIECAESALNKAIAAARAGRPVSAIGQAVETEVRRYGFHVIPQLTGHETGRTIHEGLSVPNYFDARKRKPLKDGLVIAVEPIIAAGSPRIVEAGDGWTIKTADGSLAAHAEHTIVVTKGRAIVLTAA